MNRPLRTAVAVLVAAGGVGLAPAAAAAEPLPRPGLTRAQVVPSSCPAGDSPLVYSPRPTLTARVPGAPHPDRQLRFQVIDAWALDMFPAQRKELGADLRPLARGTVGPTRPGGDTFAWRPGQDLGTGGQYAWRARVVVDGKPTSRWSVWRRFDIAYDGTPAVRECRVDAWSLQWYLARAERTGYPLDEIIRDAAWVTDFWRLLYRLGDDLPGVLAGGQAVGDGHSRRGWLAFRGEPPVAARTAVARFRATHPGSNIRLIVGREYSADLIYRRVQAAFDRLEASPLVDVRGALPDGRTGTLVFTLVRRHGVDMTAHQVREAVLADLRAHAEGYDVVPAGGGVVASEDVQPVQISVRRQ